jgi:hypothetical protein
MLSVWEVSLFLVVPFFGVFLLLEGAYWSANIIKVGAGMGGRQPSMWTNHRARGGLLSSHQDSPFTLSISLRYVLNS